MIPGNPGKDSRMIFSSRQIQYFEKQGVISYVFYLKSRTNPVVLILEWLRMRREIREMRPTIVYCHYGTMSAFLSALNFYCPTVVTYRGSDLNPVPTSNSFRVFVGHFFSHLASVFATGIICVSSGLANRLIWGKNKVCVIPTGVDTDIFYPIPKEIARQKLGLKADAVVVLFNAGFSPGVKRLDLAEQAFAEFYKSMPKAKLLVLDGNVSPNTVPLYHNAADVLLVTSDYEGSPTIVQEAIACALPVVSVDVGDVVERLKFVSPSKIVRREPREIAAGLLEIVLSKKRSNGPEVAAREISNSYVARRVVEFLSICSGHRNDL